MRGYGDPLQYSVFICNLSSTEYELMINDLEEEINHHTDSIIIINMGSIDSEKADNIRFMGQRTYFQDRDVIIV